MAEAIPMGTTNGFRPATTAYIAAESTSSVPATTVARTTRLTGLSRMRSIVSLCVEKVGHVDPCIAFVRRFTFRLDGSNHTENRFSTSGPFPLARRYKGSLLLPDGGSKIARMALFNEQSKRPQAWLTQTIGWLAYGLISALGALPYRHAYPVVLYFAGTTLAAFLASFAMLALCRRLAASRLSWPTAVAFIVACSYALGVACSMAGATLEAGAGHIGPEASHWR